MSSELENVKAQVTQAASSIDDAATATQTALSNTDEKKERLGAMGQVAMHQGLEQACEKLNDAWGTLGTAHGEASKVSTELQNVKDTMPIPEALPKLGSAISELGTSKTNLDGAAEIIRGAKTDAESVGVQGIVSLCQSAIDMIDTARSSIDTATNAVSEYQKRLEQEAQELDDLNSGASAPTPTSASATSHPNPPQQPQQKSVIEQFVEQQTPINARYAGQQFPLPDDLAAKYPGGVKFDKHGFPDFSPHAKNIVKITMRGNRDYGPNGDFGNANERAGYSRNTKHKTTGHTWHHLHDRTTMLLVPYDLHRAVRHTGGVAVINKFGVLDDNDT